MASSSARDHVEEIRRKKYSIGGDANTLAEDLHQAVKNLSAELYAKDVHFLMELIQNAEDNEYPEGVEPSLEFVITSKDITATGAPATLLIFNNEKGFSPKNIDSICGVGRSTKKGNRKSGYIGEKGIGFKSVFLITSRPYVFSNGYQIRFNEEPCKHCGLGYIVPEWIDQNPSLSQIRQIYGSGSSLPTTTLILPLKHDKVHAVKNQLSVIKPQTLLFLSKIKRLSVREDNEDPRLNTVNAISITKETDFVQRKNIDAESFTLHLSAEENGTGEECRFHMWKQRFPVVKEYVVERREEVDEWIITLAFPFGEKLEKGTSFPGIYAFLPTEMVTNFPFMIQADFLLASSREAVLLDNKWNQGILGCVPTAFVDAFKSMVKGNENTPVWSLPDIFRFLPVEASNYRELNVVRQSIKAKLLEEDIIPSEVIREQKFFHKPREVGRLMPSFWTILNKARKEGVSLLSLSSHGKYILASSFDTQAYDHILNFLEVVQVDNEWYSKCIQSSNLVGGVSEALYLELLLFIADHWSSNFQSTAIKSIPLLKYEDLKGNKSFFTITRLLQQSESLLYLSRHPQEISWLIEWNKELSSTMNRFFMPKLTQDAMRSNLRESTLLKWLQNQASVGVVDTYDFAYLLCGSLKERSLVVSYAHFLYHSMSKKGYLSAVQVDYLCSIMPLVVVDGYFSVVTQRSGVLVPAKGSKWADLIVSNLWRSEGYVELSEDYLSPGSFAGNSITSRDELLSFLKDRAGAKDVPVILPPNARIPAASSPLTKANALLLLEWIQNLRYSRIRIPDRFMESVKEGSWLRITLKGHVGYRPPLQSFLLSSSQSWGNLLQNGSVLVDIPLVDESFYGYQIKNYLSELKELGVKSEYAEACKFIGDRLMSLAASCNLTREHVLLILRFLRFLRTECLSPKEFIASVQKGKWLRTNLGDKSPAESVWFEEEWQVASQVSDIPFIDLKHYGEEIKSFKTELELLGVVISCIGRHQLIVDHLKPSSSLACLAYDKLLMLLECARFSHLSEKVFTALKGTQCLMTTRGYKKPNECVLCDPSWDCLFQVLNCVPLIDWSFYNEGIYSFREELRKMGVVVDFQEAIKLFVGCFREQAFNKSISKQNVISLLSSYRHLKSTVFFPSDLIDSIRETKWLRTRHCDYYKSPKECILYNSQWQAIAQISHLPFIDTAENCYGVEIHDYKKELKSMGVVVDFKDGASFVTAGLYFNDVKRIRSESVLSLLHCIGILLQEKGYKFPDELSKKLSDKWLRTCVGYKPPKECLLFDSKFAEHLKKTDGPFLDDEFYGPKLSSHRETLGAIGVVVNVEKGCSLIANQLDSNTEFSTIQRLYDYLSRFNWVPETESGRRIWIPNGNQKGQWTRPEDCVISDRSGLFNLKLHILDKIYKKNLLFFSTAFNVKFGPDIEDYTKLWKSWESSNRVLTREECCKFWGYITTHWTKSAEKTLPDEIVKVPVKSNSNGIMLVNKNDVFVADDLQLKELFEQSSSRAIFVWYPQPSFPSLSRTKLLEVFQKLGVRTISESVQREEYSIPNGVGHEEVVIRSDGLIGKGLVKLILGFLADPIMGMEAKERHKALESLLKLTVVETVEPINVRYNLPLSSGEMLNVRASRMVRWDRESAKIFTQKMESSQGAGQRIERATYFSEVVAEGVLWENGDRIFELSELIKLAFVMDFDEDAIAFLMRSKNLQIFEEDEAFLASAFPSN